MIESTCAHPPVHTHTHTRLNACERCVCMRWCVCACVCVQVCAREAPPPFRPRLPRNHFTRVPQGNTHTHTPYTHTHTHTPYTHTHTHTHTHTMHRAAHTAPLTVTNKNYKPAYAVDCVHLCATSGYSAQSWEHVWLQRTMKLCLHDSARCTHELLASIMCSPRGVHQVTAYSNGTVKQDLCLRVCMCILCHRS